MIEVRFRACRNFSDTELKNVISNGEKKNSQSWPENMSVQVRYFMFWEKMQKVVNIVSLN